MKDLENKNRESINSGERHLYYLNELSDYKIKDEDPDIRNWSLYDSNNQPVGKVDNLLVSKTAEKVKYVDVEVDNSILEEDHEPFAQAGADKPHEYVNRKGDNHLIVPVEMIRVDREKKRAYCDTINRNTFASARRFAKGQPIQKDYEEQIMHTYRSGSATSGQSSGKMPQGSGTKAQGSGHTAGSASSSSTGVSNERGTSGMTSGQMSQSGETKSQSSGHTSGAANSPSPGRSTERGRAGITSGKSHFKDGDTQPQSAFQSQKTESTAPKSSTPHSAASQNPAPNERTAAAKNHGDKDKSSDKQEFIASQSHKSKPSPEAKKPGERTSDDADGGKDRGMR